jgi:hypothetical protein
MNMGEELQRLHDLISDLEKQNKQLKEQLDIFHRTSGCESKKDGETISTTLGCSTMVTHVKI